MTEKNEREKTRYLVECEDEAGKWFGVDLVSANGGLAAITALAKTPGNYRAVPIRNITMQAMGNPPPEPPKLVPVDPSQIQIDGFVEPPAETPAAPEVEA